MTDIIKEIRKRFDHNSAKKILREKYEAKMLFAEFGGMWKAGPELINILESSNEEIIYLPDEYGNPCKVPRHKMLTIVRQRWQEQMNGWYTEYEEMMKER